MKAFVVLILACLTVWFAGCSPALVESTDTTDNSSTPTIEESYPPECDTTDGNIADTVTSDTEESNVTLPETSPETEGSVSDTEELPPEPQYLSSDLELIGQELKIYGTADTSLAEQLANALQGYNKNISLACWKTDGSLGIVYNTQQSYFSACTIKAPVMLYCCKLIDAGELNKDEVLTYEKRHYHGGSGKIRFNAYGSTYTVEELITLALSISDNVAYKMLVERIGRDGFNTMLTEYECPSLIVPSWSLWASYAQAQDFVKVWDKINQYFATNTLGAQILKNACTNTRFNYGSQAIPEYEYSHKSGENYGSNCAYNDAGIIWAETPYVYSVFTKSEGTHEDANTVDEVMRLVNSLMKQAPTPTLPDATLN